MSELSNTKTHRLKKLLEVSILTIETGNAKSFIDANKSFLNTVVPSDFITLFHELIIQGHSISTLKTASNKILNIFHQSIKNYPSLKPSKGSFIELMVLNNKAMDEVLDEITAVFKVFNKNQEDQKLRGELLALFEKLSQFANHYTIKENVLFPVIEKYWEDYRCIQLMWSFHDDIRKNIKAIIQQLQGEYEADIFNPLIGDVFFNMHSIMFREDLILFPFLLETIEEQTIERMIREGNDIGYPYVLPTMKQETVSTNTPNVDPKKIDLKTGVLSIEQIILIFNHLPVDITYVDENDTVQYFSTPKHRIFPRTTAIIGRNVSNCHPPESVHVVEQIVASFKSGEQSHADFWIKMKGLYILIQYFAIRDQENTFRGVVEVSQEISEIKALEGEKRLLDW